MYAVLIHIKAFDDLCGTISLTAFSRSMTNFAPGRVAVAFVLGLAAASLGCGQSDKSETDARHYEARGIVRGFATDQSTVYVEHEAILDFMPSMTMPFEVRDEKEITSLKLGDAISFRLNVTQRDSWIDRIRKIAPNQPKPASTRPDTFAQTDTDPGSRLTKAIPCLVLS